MREHLLENIPERSGRGCQMIARENGPTASSSTPVSTTTTAITIKVQTVSSPRKGGPRFEHAERGRLKPRPANELPQTAKSRVEGCHLATRP